METLYLKLFKAPDQVTVEAIAAYHKVLANLELRLKSRETKFFGGGQPAYVDLMIWPWFERYMAFDHDKRVTIDETKYGRLVGSFFEAYCIECSHYLESSIELKLKYLRSSIKRCVPRIQGEIAFFFSAHCAWVFIVLTTLFGQR